MSARARAATKTLCTNAEHGTDHFLWPVWAATSEKDLQANVERMAKRLGWLTYHTWGSMHSQGGFPDLVLVRSYEMHFVELKTVDGRVSDDQAAWGDELQGAGASWLVWRPCDMDEIEEVLR